MPRRNHAVPRADHQALLAHLAAQAERLDQLARRGRLRPPSAQLAVAPAVERTGSGLLVARCRPVDALDWAP